MRKLFMALAVAATLAVPLIAAGPASADTVSGPGCAFYDYKVTNGTTITVAFGPDCTLTMVAQGVGYGAPTIVISNPDGGDLVQHLSYGRHSADDPCKDGYGKSWAGWMNDGRGGFTCDLDVVWGKAAPNPLVLSATINSTNDLAAFFTVNGQGIPGFQYLLGCSVTPQGQYPLIGNCPPD